MGSRHYRGGGEKKRTNHVTKEKAKEGGRAKENAPMETYSLPKGAHRNLGRKKKGEWLGPTD